MHVNTGVEYLLKLNKENNPVICCESSRILESTVTQCPDKPFCPCNAVCFQVHIWCNYNDYGFNTVS